MKTLPFTTAIFTTTLLVSNLLSSAKFIDLSFSVFGLPVVFDAGTLVFPLAYIFGDVLTEVYGYQNAKRVIWLGFLNLALFTAFIGIVGMLPPESGWDSAGGQAAYEFVFGGLGSLAVASLTAYVVGSLANAWVMNYLRNGKYLPARTIGSTLVGQALDTLVFFVIGVVLGVFPSTLLISFMVANYVFKVGIEVLFTPITITVIKIYKRIEA